MLIQKIKTYKWQALASLLMTGLMVASSLLQPRYLQEVLGALLTGKYEAIYSIGAWLIGVAVVGLVAGGLNVVLAAYIAQGVSSDLREDAFRKIQTFSYADIEQFNAMMDYNIRKTVKVAELIPYWWGEERASKFNEQ
ncbi:ABC transporter ATP-binding protein/permease [Streptococcus pneumoniae]|nr:ABC transporter ATP-binding protein/permease [Streptococcus pneumoniae]